jgi:threonine synthase
VLRGLCYTLGLMSALRGLECPQCGGTFDADRLQSICSACASPLLARYDLAPLADLTWRRRLAERQPGIWRWAELLPVRDERYRISLGEGDTPISRTDRLAGSLGLKSLYIKEEGSNPTGSFKARGMAVALSRAAELGVRSFVAPTAGNAGGALAAYCARAGLAAHVVMPQDAPLVNRIEVKVTGADLHLVDGLIDLAGRQASALAAEHGWWDVSSFKEPYRVEGKKTIGLELAQAFDWQLPDVIVYPTGGGVGLVGMWKAFEELQLLGWIEDRRPRMMVVQAEGCAPVVEALESGAERVSGWADAHTQAAGLRVPHPYADRLILRTVRESGGCGAAVAEGAIRQGQDDMARLEGIYACPESGAGVAGLRQLIQRGLVETDERVVIFNTATGLKY